MTNSFIETQKELARKNHTVDDFNGFIMMEPEDLDTLITQVIQNTLEEVARRTEPDNTVSLIAQAIREERKKVLEEVGRMKYDLDGAPEDDWEVELDRKWNQALDTLLDNLK